MNRLAGGRVILNAVAFQVFWFAMVLAVAAGRPALCWPLAAAALGLHFALAPDRRGEARFIIACAALGWSGDLLLTVLRLYDAGPWPPLWLLAFWLNFATLPRHSLAWLAGRPRWAILLGAVGGPLAYGSAAALGAIELHPTPALSYACLAALWAIEMPCFMRLAALAHTAPKERRIKEPRTK